MPKIYRKVGADFTELPARVAGRLYKLAAGPDGQPAEVELTTAEEAQRASDAAARTARRAQPVPLTAEQRLAAIEARLPDAGGAVRPKP